MRYTVLGLTLVFMLTAQSHASELLSPDPEMNPQQVVSIQLEALRINDVPYQDAGIAQVWAFAHPDNKLLTGPLSRFTQMIKNEAYRILIGHTDHKIELVSKTITEALFAVSVTASDGKVYGYRWNVKKVLSGEFAGAWMTSAVSAPIPLSEDI